MLYTNPFCLISKKVYIYYNVKENIYEDMCVYILYTVYAIKIYYIITL